MSATTGEIHHVQIQKPDQVGKGPHQNPNISTKKNDQVGLVGGWATPLKNDGVRQLG